MNEEAKEARTDLSFATLEELLDELQARHPGGLVLLGVENAKTGDGEDCSMSYRGGYWTAWGLVQWAQERFSADVRNQRRWSGTDAPDGGPSP